MHGRGGIGMHGRGGIKKIETRMSEKENCTDLFSIITFLYAVTPSIGLGHN